MIKKAPIGALLLFFIFAILNGEAVEKTKKSNVIQDVGNLMANFTNNGITTATEIGKTFKKFTTSIIGKDVSSCVRTMIQSIQSLMEKAVKMLVKHIPFIGKFLSMFMDGGNSKLIESIPIFFKTNTDIVTEVMELLAKNVKDTGSLFEPIKPIGEILQTLTDRFRGINDEIYSKLTKLFGNGTLPNLSEIELPKLPNILDSLGVRSPAKRS